MMGTRNVLPEGYTAASYIENTCGDLRGLLNTGIVFNPITDSFWIVFSFKFDEEGNIQQILFGNNSSTAYPNYLLGTFFVIVRRNDSYKDGQILINMSSGRETPNYYSLGKTGISEGQYSIEYTCCKGKMSFRINNAVSYERNSLPSDEGGLTDVTAKLFGYPTYNPTIWNGKVYRLYWTRNGLPIADYMPCVRDEDSMPGFYDFATDTFKTIPNANTLWTAGVEE